MTTPNDRTGDRKVWKRGWKRPLSEAQLGQRREAGKKGGKKGGRAVVEKYGRQHFSEMGKKGGKWNFFDTVAKAKSREANAAASRPRPGRVRETKEV